MAKMEKSAISCEEPKTKNRFYKLRVFVLPKKKQKENTLQYLKDIGWVASTNIIPFKFHRIVLIV